MMDDDYALALQLQSELFDDTHDSKSHENEKQLSALKNSGNEPVSLIDPYWELTDPNPDVRALFLQFNERFFWGRLAGIEVRWSPRMTLCAGLCCYEGRGGLCSVRLSVPLLKLRPRKDLVETLLHEMIHAYLFVTDNNKDHDGHGPEFHKHMYRINAEAGTGISVYHNFHDEVDAYKQHWWRCNGPCQKRKPFFGYVKRSMNRAPSKNDTWWAEHQRTCGGTFTKIKEPENYGKKSKNKDGEEKEKVKSKGKSGVRSMDIRIFGGTGKTLGQPKTGNTTTIPGNVTPKPTATITSGVLERTSNDIISLDDDDIKNCDILPGSKTPSKSRVTGKKLNKPVSQGGNATFDEIKKNKTKFPDFSDSDDDDEMCRLEEISNREKNNVFGKYDGDLKDGFENGKYDGDLKDGFENVKFVDEDDSNEINFNHDGELYDVTSFDKSDKKDMATTESGATSVLKNDKTAEIDSGAVRAMLRKVWGEKKFRSTNGTGDNKSGQSISGFNKNGISGSLSDIGSRSTGVKRPSIDNDLNLQKKRQKTNNKDNYMIHSISGNDKYSVENKGDHAKAKITSPIKDLFDRMRERQNVSKPPLMNIPSASGYACDNNTCDKTRLGEETNLKGENSDNTAATNLADIAPCPVCSKSVPASIINDHLDLCLTLQAIG